MVQDNALIPYGNHPLHCQTAEPIFEHGYSVSVMIAYNKVYVSIKRIKYIPTVLIVAETHITEMKHQAIFRHLHIPSADKLFIMLLYILERPGAKAQYIGMVKMSV